MTAARIEETTGLTDERNLATYAVKIVRSFHGFELTKVEGEDWVFRFEGDHENALHSVEALEEALDAFKAQLLAALPDGPTGIPVALRKRS